MMVREPGLAGSWYPAGREACVRAIEALRPKQTPPSTGGRTGPEGLPERPVAGIVPHAGWSFSGATALAVFDAIRSRRTPKTFVLLGFCHRRRLARSAVFPEGGWDTPLGLVEVDARLAGEVLARAPDLADENPGAHVDENSIELQVPFIRHLFPEARIVPIAVVPNEKAVMLGRIIGQVIAGLEADAVCIGSTDLTHYGAPYGFAPQGFGAAGIRWMRDENDKRMIDLMERLDAEAAVPEAQANSNACGPGAVAATLAAARELGAARGHVVQYTTSYDVMRREMGREDAQAAVGYAGVVF